MITKEQLQAMSDFQLSVTIADLLGWNVLFREELPATQTVVRKAPQERPCGFDCNTPNDIMPLAFEHKLCLISPHSHTKTWSARQTDGGGLWSVSDFTYSDTNPLRAIACCLVLVLQEKGK